MSGPTAISLFSGLGGMDIGLHRAGVKTLVTLDSDNWAAESLRANSSKYKSGIAGSDALYNWIVIKEDIHDVTADQLIKAAGTNEIDFIVGGPPCQTFSRSNEGNREGTDATRGMLYQEYARFLREIEPKAFIFENVRGLASANDGKDFNIIKEEFENSGYTINDSVLNAADYGVPQTRQRLFIAGFCDGEKPYFPDPTHVEAENTLTGKSTWVTAKEALVDFDIDAELAEEAGYENAVGGKYGYLLKDIPPGGNYQHFTERRYDPKSGEYVARDEDELDAKVFDWRSRHYNYLLKQDPNRPTWTLQAAPGTYVGPFHWRSRRYSFLEEMRLMDIPVDYEICGPPREIQRQIGNAVPPGLAESIVRSLSDQLGLATTDRGDPNVPLTARTDGGDKPVNQDSIEVGGSRSPWRYAEEAITSIQQGQQISIQGRGKRIAQVIDVLELSRRRFERDLEINLEETVITDPEGHKSERLSVLHADIASK